MRRPSDGADIGSVLNKSLEGTLTLNVHKCSGSLGDLLRMRAKPKSQSLMTPVLVRRMFSGFTSRWMHCNINAQAQGCGNMIHSLLVTERETYIKAEREGVDVEEQ